MKIYLLPVIALCCVIGTSSSARGEDFDYAQYAALLKQYVKPDVVIDGISVNALDYTLLAQDATMTNSMYSLLLRELAAFDPDTLESREEKIAFWLNVYNIASIKTIVDHYPVDSIRSRQINWLGLPWGRKAIMVGGKEYSLEEIEFGKLVEGYKDLRVHFGINCASVSCVDLRIEPYRAPGLFKELEEQGKRFLVDPKKGLRIDHGKNTVYLSQVFKFDKKHFDAYAGGAIMFILPYVVDEERGYLRSGQYKVEFLNYDWNANDLKNAR